ncbi:hypothetical protein, partial [Escherichia coli]|uniref:hypothetical protein n=1 Tax=Escherichia coli TaxID=562 RepID=UPI0015C44D41
MLELAARQMEAPAVSSVPAIDLPAEQIPSATVQLFVGLTRSAGGAEHLRAVQQLGDRLALYRR